MQVGIEGKKYGLQIPKSKLKSAFGSGTEDDDSEDSYFNEKDKSKDNTNEEYRHTLTRTENTKTQRIQDDALLQDPSAFDYDAVYDSMKQDRSKKSAERSAIQSDSRPKYIHNLLEQANKKKREFERVQDRQIQREREAEGDMYKDKEVFITSGYKKKLEERRKQDELDRLKEEAEEGAKKDMGSFHRNLYNTMNTTSTTTTTGSKGGINDKYSKYDDDIPPPAKSSTSRTNDNNNNSKGGIKDKYSKYDDEPIQETKPKFNNTVGGLVYKGGERSKPNNNRDNRDNRDSRDHRDYRDNRDYRNRDDKSTRDNDMIRDKVASKKIEENKPRYPRRNDEQSIQAARERYLKRKEDRMNKL